MLKSITLKNFKSYVDATLPVAGMTFLIGTNTSGKSNALEAIRLLSWLAKGSRVYDIERDIQSGSTMIRGLAKDLFLDAEREFELGVHVADMPDGWNDFAIGLRYLNGNLIIATESITRPGEVALYQIDSEPNAHTDEVRVAYNNFLRGRNKPGIPCSNRLAIFYQIETPGRFEQGHPRSQELIPAVVKALRQTLRNIVFLDPRPGQMRAYVYAGDDAIKEDGSNLSAVLYKICHSDPASKQKLLAFIRSLPEQNITDVDFIKTERQDVMVRLEETFGGKTRIVDAPLLSDGTLRVLAIAGTLLTAEEGALVVIEEIDNGVHPSRADVLVKQIEVIANERKLRVLVNSHNPALLDALPDGALADVLCCYRDPLSGASQLVRLGNMDRYPELVALGPLGQLMTTRVLERFLKDTSTTAGRRAAALEWLQSLKSSTRESTE